ncbi:exo-alpha-sialidase [Carboxylicivirga linearis]|uniref:Exo-alpha-sialidase n=1 Tax=Carboxylicivirga linearis TaxID=1628157 RepID=A0ABS5JZ27_9BACT|nr:exo-alpha-sialidase [Carboxylicivirga linearis]MBS2100116.1 exo-alpha-sialidase [Carboxylicivirga linearis]
MLVLAFIFSSCLPQTHFTVKEGLFDQEQTNDLGLPEVIEAETFTIYTATDSTDKYVNGAVMTSFKGKLYCMWQSSEKDEDSTDTWVAYSSSNDGINWETPKVFETSPENAYCTSGGWWVKGDTIIAFINEWSYDESPRFCKVKYRMSTDGVLWSDKESVTWADGSEMIGAFEQDPHQITSGRIINAVHISPGLHVTPVFTDDAYAISGWQKGDMINMEYSGDVTREIEPSTYQRKDGASVMVFRDQKSSFCKLASVSLDEGRSWSEPMLTNMPDARTKQSAGNLPDGSAYFVGNPLTNKSRMPLVLTLSEDGHVFNKAFVLRKASDLPQLKYEGKYKRQGYHYPKSMVADGFLYTSYTTNKERVECTRIPLHTLMK